jgi:hypothetical protein
MTDQHRATPEQWAEQEMWVRQRPHAAAGSSCILELRARIEELEAAQHAHADTTRLSNGGVSSTVVEGLSNPGRWQPLRTEIAYGEANAHAQDLVRHLSMDQPAPSPAVGRVRDLQDQIRDGSLTLEEALMELAGTTPAPAPADSLVERVEAAVDVADIETGCQARAAIREVAAALIDWHDSDQVVRTAWEAAKWLEQQANQ